MKLEVIKELQDIYSENANSSVQNSDITKLTGMTKKTGNSSQDTKKSKGKKLLRTQIFS